MSDNHGNTVAAWTAVGIALLAFVVAGIGTMIPNWPVIWIGASCCWSPGSPGSSSRRWATGPTPTTDARAAVLTEVGRSRTSRTTAPLVLGGLVLATTVALHLHDPHQQGSWGLCPFKLLTGWDCPGCGGLRAVNDLTNGDVAAAVGSNLLFVASLPLLVALWGRWLWRTWTGQPPRPSGPAMKPLVTAYFALLLVFTVVRNTPWGSALYA